MIKFIIILITLFETYRFQISFEKIGLKDELMMKANAIRTEKPLLYVEFDNTAEDNYNCIKNANFKVWGKDPNYSNCYRDVLKEPTSMDFQKTSNIETCACDFASNNYFSTPLIYQLFTFSEENNGKFMKALENRKLRDVRELYRPSLSYQINQKPSKNQKEFSIIGIPPEDVYDITVGFRVNLKSCIRKIYLSLNKYISEHRAGYASYIYIQMDYPLFEYLNKTSTYIGYDYDRECIIGDYSLDVDLVCLKALDVLKENDYDNIRSEKCLKIKSRLIGEVCHGLASNDGYMRCSHVDPLPLTVFDGYRSNKKYISGDGEVENQLSSLISFAHTLFTIGLSFVPCVGVFLVLMSELAYTYFNQDAELNDEELGGEISRTEINNLVESFKDYSKLVNLYLDTY